MESQAKFKLAIIGFDGKITAEIEDTINKSTLFLDIAEKQVAENNLEVFKFQSETKPDIVVLNTIGFKSSTADAISQIKADGTDSLFSVAEIEDFFIWKQESGENPQSINYDYKDRKPRQQIETTYLENGSFYLFRPQVLINDNNRIGGDTSLFVMDRYKMFQIDNDEDIELSAVIMKGFGLDAK